MSDTATRLRTWLLTDSTISTAVGGTKIHQNQVPERASPPWIYLRRNSRQPNDDLNCNDIISETFDVECVSTSLSQAQSMADAIWSHDRFRGTFGDSTTPGIFVNDQNDDYIPFSVGSDDGYEIASLMLTVYLP